MQNGTCPKCKATQVYSNEKLRFKSGTYNSNTIPLSFFRTIPLDNYICTSCGYTESYVAEPEMLNRIRDMWEYVEPK